MDSPLVFQPKKPQNKPLLRKDFSNILISMFLQMFLMERATKTDQENGMVCHFSKNIFKY